MTAPSRLPCVVPFCRRTRGSTRRDPLPADLSGWEWICGPHWRGVGRRSRDLYAAVKRRLRHTPIDEARRRQRDRVWERCKREAIEAAAGIAS